MKKVFIFISFLINKAYSILLTGNCLQIYYKTYCSNNNVIVSILIKLMLFLKSTFFVMLLINKNFLLEKLTPLKNYLHTYNVLFQSTSLLAIVKHIIYYTLKLKISFSCST